MYLIRTFILNSLVNIVVYNMFYISNVIGDGQARDIANAINRIQLLICKCEIPSYPV